MVKTWPMESATPTKVKKPPQSDGFTEETIRVLRLEFSAFGFLLVKSRDQLGAPVSSVFTGIAYLRMLAGHRRRWKKEIQRSNTLKNELARKSRAGGQPGKPYYLPPLPFKMKWKDLRVVDCAGCRKVLLGESMEYYRKRAVEQGSILVKNIPPKVRLRHDDRPFCASCVIEGRHRG